MDGGALARMLLQQNKDPDFDAQRGGMQIRQATRGVQTAAGEKNLASLSVDPASPEYRAKIAQMAGDFSDEPAPPPKSSLILPDSAAPQAVPAQRLAMHYGPQLGVLIVALEEAPDWDSVDSWKLTPEQLAPVVPLLDALKIRISDKTGGTLKEIRDGAYDARPNRKGQRKAPARGAARGTGTRRLPAHRPAESDEGRGEDGDESAGGLSRIGPDPDDGGSGSGCRPRPWGGASAVAAVERFYPGS